MANKEKVTPLMQQFHEIKKEYADTLLLFQVGDFYELFFDDAQKAAAFLGIALTKRGKQNGKPIPLCGVPVHALNHYLTKLVKGGFKVAICDQLEPAQPGKVVARGVTQVLTPGTLTDDTLLDARSASYLFSYYPKKQHTGLLFGELMTAQLCATVVPTENVGALESELIRFFPDEVIIPDTPIGKKQTSFFRAQGYYTTFVSPKDDYEQQFQQWLQQFDNKVQEVLQTHQVLYDSLRLFYQYLYKTQQSALDQFRQLQFYEPDEFLILDKATQRNLELVQNNQDATRKNTLFSVLDGATTAMGSRTIKKWLLRPLVDKKVIHARQNAVQLLVSEVLFFQQIKDLLNEIGDIERVVGRIALGRARQADYLMVLQILVVVPQIKALLLQRTDVFLLRCIGDRIGDFTMLHQLLQVSLNVDSTRDWIIKKGFDQELDRVRNLVENGNDAIVALEKTEIKKTGISSLKIRYNGAHGYYIEVTKTHVKSVPENYIRKQTLVGRERYVTKELQSLAYEIEQSKSQVGTLEQQLFDRVKREVHGYMSGLRTVAHALSHLDALLGLASVAYKNGYVRPVISSTNDIKIVQGRHPVVEQRLSGSFVANDTALTDDESLWILTGPNMGGKSTYLRQVALISIMSHIGSFVPAQAAQVPILDRVFTRIGASDNVAEGKSTFLVEMEETATICRYATKNSLVILDEVGRGTSTFDGLAIAQAVIEYLYTQVQARCLFATHYHELTALEKTFAGITSYYVSSKKNLDDTIVLLHTIVKGVADGSFGVAVARCADLPSAVVQRAQELVIMHGHKDMAVGQSDTAITQLVAENNRLKKQCIALDNQIKVLHNTVRRLESIDYENLSPKKAFDMLWELKENN